MVIVFVLGLYTPMWPKRPVGNSENAPSCVQAGVPPRPFAFVKTHASPSMLVFEPPKIISRLLQGSYTVLFASRTGGSVPEGASCVHVGVPPCPLAFESTHTSLLPAPEGLTPPKTISPLLAES